MTDLNSKEAKRVMAKIAKLLAMAEHEASNPTEAATAARQAEALLRKHNLTMGDLTPEQAKDNVTETSVEQYKWTPGRAPAWVGQLAVAIGKATDTYVMWAHSTQQDSHVRRDQMHLRFVGLEMDVTVAMQMFVYLYKTINRLTDEYAVDPTTFIPAGKARTVKNSFRQGAASSIASRLREAAQEKQEEYQAAGTGLMVVKQDAIEKHLGRKADYSTSKRKASTDYSAMAAGRAAGNSVSLNKQLS